MEKNSMGKFIAALRKAKGLTQQDVADAVCVSNKAVSRWERDESCPDLSIIPALAELLDVTCDELLNGERIINDNNTESKPDIKVDKRRKLIINKSITTFKTMTCVAIALAVIGLVCMFGISYALYRPVIGFWVMLVIEIISCMAVAVNIGVMKSIKSENELVESAEQPLIDKFNLTVANFSFMAFVVITVSVLLSVSVVVNSSAYSVVNMYYIMPELLTVLLAAVFIVIEIRPCIVNRLCGINNKDNFVKTSRMNIIQLCCIAVAVVMIFCSAYFMVLSKSFNSLMSQIATVVGLVLLVSSIIVFIVYAIRAKDERAMVMTKGIRNVLLAIIALLLLFRAIYVTATDGIFFEVGYDTNTIVAVLILSTVVFAVFGIIQGFVQRRVSR